MGFVKLQEAVANQQETVITCVYAVCAYYLWKILLHIQHYGDMLGELMCETKYIQVQRFMSIIFSANVL